jgi:hypothetical protein
MPNHYPKGSEIGMFKQKMFHIINNCFIDKMDALICCKCKKTTKLGKNIFMDGLDDNCCHVGLVIVKQSS